MAYTDIDKPDEYFNTVLYTGNGGTQTISGVGFEPDFTWIKVRSTADNHSLEDQVRGANKHLRSDSTLAETESGTAHITSWNSDGFVLGSGDGQTNGSSQTYVAWNWLASNTTASNTAGSITSTVSANTTSGFSIVSYTGTGANATVGHGLGAVPKMIIQKNRIDGQPWWVYFSTIGAGGQLRLEETDAQGSDGGVLWNSTAPTSTVFSLGDNGGSNGSSDACIAYCFAEKKGFSKFGKYTGNGNADGTFIYTGFKPAFVMLKRTDSTGDWQIQDSKRPEYNPLPFYLEANNSNAEVDWTSSFPLDFVSNGMKIRNSGTQMNPSGGSFIYMAFAESPFTTSTGIPCTAR